MITKENPLAGVNGEGAGDSTTSNKSSAETDTTQLPGIDLRELAVLSIWMPHGKRKSPQYINATGVFAGIDWDKSEHWMPRDMAQAIVEANPGLLTGVGIVIDRNTVINGQRLVAIDVDLIEGYRKADPEKGIEAVTFDPLTDADKVRQIVPLIGQIDSYWEASPSCTGVHTIALASEAWAAHFANTGKFFPGGCDHAEFYTGEEPTYITVTGVSMGPCNTIGALSDAVQAYLAPLLKPAGGKATTMPDIEDGDAFDLNRLTCFNASQRQMIEGKVPQGKRSDIVHGLLIALIDDLANHPIADIKASVLANEHMLAYFSKHPDAGKFASEEINRAYARSQRSKRQALIGFNDKWKPATPNKPTAPSVVDAPLEARHLATDQANAVRLQRAAGGHIMHAAGRWYVWTGTHWCDDRAAAYRKTCDLSKLIDLEADDWRSRPTKSKEEKDKNDAIAKALAKWGKDSEMKQRLDAAFALLQTLVEVPAERLDSDPYALNVANGTIDLRSGKLQQHDKADLITHCIPIAYDPKAEAPLFKQALDQITGGNQPLAEFLQRWFGYCANGVTSEQKFAVHHGDGANGKSLLLDTIGGVLGPYAGATAPGLLMAGGQNRHPAEIADLFGMRMATAHESGEGGALNEDRIKQATGSDKLKARYMRQDYFEFLPTHTFNLLTNHKPQIRGQDMGIWRRVMLVPYGVTFGTAAEVAQGLAQHVRDDRLGEALKAEAAGILVWVVRGAVTWYMTGLRPPDVVLAASAEYRSEQDRVGQFLTERGEQYTEDWVPCDGLFKDYQVWCKDCGYFSLGKNNFIAAVEKRPGIKKQMRRIDWYGKDKQLRCFTGLKTAF